MCNANDKNERSAVDSTEEIIRNLDRSLPDLNEQTRSEIKEILLLVGGKDAPEVKAWGVKQSQGRLGRFLADVYEDLYQFMKDEKGLSSSGARHNALRVGAVSSFMAGYFYRQFEQNKKVARTKEPPLLDEDLKEKLRQAEESLLEACGLDSPTTVQERVHELYLEVSHGVMFDTNHPMKGETASVGCSRLSPEKSFKVKIIDWLGRVEDDENWEKPIRNWQKRMKHDSSLRDDGRLVAGITEYGDRVVFNEEELCGCDFIPYKAAKYFDYFVDRPSSKEAIEEFHEELDRAKQQAKQYLSKHDAAEIGRRR